MRAWAKREKAPIVEAPVPHEAVDALKSSHAYPDLIDQPPTKQEAYVTMDALKNFMSSMTGAITQQVSK